MVVYVIETNIIIDLHRISQVTPPVFKQGSAQSCHHLGNKNASFVEKGYFYNALKRYEKGWSEVI